MNKLTQIQAELKAPKSNYNSFGKYKYRSCEDILEAVKPLLLKHKCSLRISDEIKEIGGITFVESTVLFKDEKSVNEVTSTAQAGIDINRKGMDIAQSFGSSSSYARKYALSGLFLIDDNKEIDSVEQPKTKVEQPKTKETLDSSHESFFKALKAVQDGYTTIEKIKEHYKITPDALKLLQGAK